MSTNVEPDVTAVILAGGLGTRLRSALPDCPKVLAPVAGRPFITRLLDQLVDARLHRVVLATGYRGSQIEAALGPMYRHLELEYSSEPAALGTGGALRLALPLVHTRQVLLLNGDSFCDADLEAFAQWHVSRQAHVSLLLVWAANAARYGRVQLAADGTVAGFAEKQVNPEPGWISAGVCLLERAKIESIPPGLTTSLERDCFPAWVGEHFHGWQRNVRFLDIGTPESYRAAEAFFTPDAYAVSSL